MRVSAFCFLALSFLSTIPALAQAPAQIAFQGVLEDGSSPVTDPSATLTFRLYAAETGSSAVWTETQTGVDIDAGAFSVLLGTTSALDALDMDRPLWLSVAVGDATATELPRSPLAAAPYALALPGVSTSPTGSERFVGVNRSTPVNEFEYFGIHSDRTSGFAGMYVTGGGPSVLPYYGYAPDETDLNDVAFHYYDSGRWALNNGGFDRLHVLSDGFVGLGRSTPVNEFEDFGVHSDRTTGFAGMYVTGGGPGVRTYYGYAPSGTATSNDAAFHYYDQAANRWSLNVGDFDRLHVLSNGNVGIGTSAPTEALEVDGSIRADEVLLNGSDLAEHFTVRNAGAATTPEPGTVLSIDPEAAGGLIVSSGAYERTVAGVVSGAGGVRPGILMSQPGTLADGDVPVAIAGRVYVRADASNGPIRPGDFLTTADRPGHAMRADDAERARGATLGKAMSALDEGTGLVLVLVVLQ